MTNTKSRKVIALITAAIMLVGVTIVGTLAYLTDKTEVVTNTFTAGNVYIDLDEAETNEYGEPTTPAKRVKANAYTLVPGLDYTKDPTVYVKAGSEECYLFVEVTDEIAAIQDATTVADQMIEKGWTNVTGNIYVKTETVKKLNTEQQFVVFENFTVKSDTTKEELATYTGKTIKVTAYAVQAEGFANASEAWNATFGK